MNSVYHEGSVPSHNVLCGVDDMRGLPRQCFHFLYFLLLRQYVNDMIGVPISNTGASVLFEYIYAHGTMIWDIIDVGDNCTVMTL